MLTHHLIGNRQLEVSDVTAFFLFILFTLLSLVLMGCGNDGATGVAGAPGVPGPQGPPGTTPILNLPAPTSLVGHMTLASINSGILKVSFNLEDQDGQPYTALSGFRFTLAKLVPGGNGDTSHWQSYINQIETVDGVGSGTSDTIQATYERDGELINHNDGSYTYTFVTNLDAVVQPLAVAYQGQLTHRVALQISGNDQPVANIVYDWQPSSGNTQGLFTRNLVKTQNCNSCHGKLALHGSGRTEVDYCVTCHNPGSIDANSGESVDFQSLIHKLHRGAQLPSVVNGGEYAIWGFRDSKHDYSALHYPQDINNCSKCHDDQDPQTPDAAQWHQLPSIQACGSCHDDVDFALGKEGGHGGGIAVDNSECSVCHRQGALVGSVQDSHQILSSIAAKAFNFEILAVDQVKSGQFPVITFQVTDPQNQHQTFDILNHPAFTAGGGASRLAIDLAWGTGRDYTNHGSTSGVASTVSINALQSATDNGDGSFTSQSAIALPASAQGTLSVAIEGHPAADYDGDGVYSDQVPVTSRVAHFAINDTEVVTRREVVELAKCNNCHQQLSLHGGNRNDNLVVCAMCHNANNTDINRRPSDTTLTLDAKKEASVDFKTMIHAIHAAQMREQPSVFWGFGFPGTEHDFSQTHFPNQLENCEVCHIPGTYALPLSPQVLASTIDSGQLLNDASDDVKVSAGAAVCSSCHDSALAKAHMIQNGGASYTSSQQDIDEFIVVETCQFCHGDGQTADVKKVHQIH